MRGFVEYVSINKIENYMKEIYPAAEGTIGITWDGSSLWTSQKTCEVWNDGKIFQFEILDDQILFS